MRYPSYRFLNGLKLTALSLAAFGLGLFPLLSTQKTAFEGGKEYTFYLKSPSSQAQILRCPTPFAPLCRFFIRAQLTGESTVYRSGNAYELLVRYGGELLFQERAAGVTSYYGYAPGLGEGILLGGEWVNLHIAVRADGSVCVGTPIIFGGY